MNVFDIPKITAKNLRGLVLKADLPGLLGIDSRDERNAALQGVHDHEYRIVAPADISAERTDDPAADARVFLTVEEARAVLPPTYREHEFEGAVYPALRHPPTVVIRGYLPAQVERVTEQLEDYRAEVQAALDARKAERKAQLDAWLAGDASVGLSFGELANDREHGRHWQERMI